MTKKTTKQPSDHESGEEAIPEEAYKAYAAHTLAQMIYQQLAAGSPAPATAWVPPAGGLAAVGGLYSPSPMVPVYGQVYGQAWPPAMPAWPSPQAAPVAPTTLLYWYP